MTSFTPRDEPWHVWTPERVLAELGSGAAGLSEAEASLRLTRLGRNRLPETPPRPAWAVLLDQFRNLLILMLLAAGLLAGLIGDTVDMMAVLAVTLFNAILGFSQERRAGRILDALKAMLAQQARVRRHGRVATIIAELLVPGDVVLLEPGDRVPAD
ncbi:MAG: metal-transporting ATPase, partial [Magnetospirillum sp.]